MIVYPIDSISISIHAPPRGATRFSSGTASMKRFQFTPLREGRRCIGGCTRRAECISIHAPPRGATIGIDTFHIYTEISIHAPPRGATVHGVCWGYWNLISIHAPPRGATVGGRGRNAVYAISIHAPPRGATHPKHLHRAGGFDFNSRPSARGDGRWERGEAFPSPISIHAPPRGATQVETEKKTATLFQFTPLREGRQTKRCIHELR